MEKEKISVVIGEHKQLTYEADTANEQEMEFAQPVRAIASTKPMTIQDFFTRLNALSTMKTEPYARDIDQETA